MAEYSPAEAAQQLGIAPGTLRKWSQSFASLLSPPAAASGPRARRRYSDSDMAVLRHAGMLLDQGKTYSQVLAELGEAVDIAETLPLHSNSIMGSVEVLQPSDQAAAIAQLVEAQRQIVEAQRALIAQQQEQLTSLASQLAEARAQVQETLAQLADARAKEQPPERPWWKLS